MTMVFHILSFIFVQQSETIIHIAEEYNKFAKNDSMEIDDTISLNSLISHFLLIFFFFHKIESKKKNTTFN